MGVLTVESPVFRSYFASKHPESVNAFVHFGGYATVS
jgi:ABC-type taurine transport system substrate-binding protein